MENDNDSNIQTSSSCDTTTIEYNNKSEDLQENLNATNIDNKKAFNIIALSKKIMLKPFVAFTKTDATRLYNSAEIKNIVIKYLQESGLIMQIDDLFLSSSPTKRAFKPEIGFLKLFPVSQSASDTSTFETKLREKVGITFDDYANKVFNDGGSSLSTSSRNNMFNTAYHNWLLNLYWYDKLKEGHISVYYQNKIICPDTNMNLPMVTIFSVSNDNVHDSFDRPRSKLTASQRTSKELRRLGAKRQKESDDDPPPKRRRKPKRFADEDY
ncbi:unnamed protein product [Rotaria sp. Silwood1]|nr:unnamed protein product [Rotaria sp. Silwood1]